MIWIGILAPFIGTVLGAASVYAFRDALPAALQRTLLGFASGVMVAASVWSLLIPAMDQCASMGKLAFVPTVLGFLLGIFFLLLIDRLLPHLHLNDSCPEGLPCRLPRSTMMILAVTLHNLPEGMAVGITLAGFLSGDVSMSASGVLALSLGIALQNLPEGAVVSLPLKNELQSGHKAFLAGAASGIVEPIGALLALALTSVILPALPVMLSFAAGSMIYVVVEELLPEASAGEHSNLSTLGFSAGFLLMMILDTALQ